MCGIFCEIVHSNGTPTHVYKDEDIKQRLKNRGPDRIDSLLYVVNEELSIYFCGSVLWMQGEVLTKQPNENEHGILLFNGDIFEESWNSQMYSDTSIIMDKLSKADSSKHIIAEIKKLKGPFSIIYYDKLTQCLYFTRDRIGRNTLLIQKSNNSTVISSVLGRKYQCAEIPATFINKLDLLTNNITSYLWESEIQNPQHSSFEDWINIMYKEQNSPDESYMIEFDETESYSSDDEVIKYIESISKMHKDKKILFEKLLEYDILLKTVQKLSDLLHKSVKIRLETQPLRCKSCINNKQQCPHSATGILFSGGLDCTILALLADKYVPKYQSIDLLNVAFKTGKSTSFDVPDRLTGRQSFEELEKLCPDRLWIFREINITSEKLEKYKSEIIGDLIHPRRTVLDESLGSALWFAAYGYDSNDVSPCRVLLVGSGADELFGGYIRHRNALKRNGWPGLSRELLLDWKRISFRNLARDNRVICDHGRQPRMPYLDEDFVNFVINLKPWLRCFPTANLEVGVGDKLILRLVALYLGLTNAATLPKRALQFGSRIANSKQKGSDISKTLSE